MIEPRIKVPENIKPFLEIENCSDFPLNRFFITEQTQTILNDIISLKGVVEEMRGMGINYINSTLLYGPSGTGKTTIGRYIAHMLNLDFIYINFAKIMDGAFGQTAKNICDVFEFIAGVECVFMMDEIDGITVRRSTESSFSGSEMSRITITVMQELDYLKKCDSRSVILAATKRKDIIDEALLSRFAISYEVSPLNNADKQKYIRNFLDQLNIPYNLKNIQEYCVRNSYVTNRNVESDMIRCIAQWIKEGKQENGYVLRHIGQKITST